MRYAIVVAFMSFFLLSGNAFFSQQVSDINEFKIKVPEKLMTEILNSKPDDNPEWIIAGFYKLIFPDSIFVNTDTSAISVMKTLSADLDGDKQNEVLGLFSFEENKTSMGLFKKIDKNWYLIYAEHIYSWHSQPEINIIDTNSKNKVFYFRQVNDHSSEAFLATDHFYRLIDGKIYHCLGLVNEAHLYGANLGQDVSSKIQPMEIGDDISVTYKYRFLPGILSGITSPGSSSSGGNAYVEGVDRITYFWDSTNCSYRPVFISSDSLKLTRDKISCFGDFKNDTLFVHAFRTEINKTMREGSPVIKKMLSKYLKEIKQKSRPSSAIELLDNKAVNKKLELTTVRKKKQ